MCVGVDICKRVRVNMRGVCACMYVGCVLVVEFAHVHVQSPVCTLRVWKSRLRMAQACLLDGAATWQLEETLMRCVAHIHKLMRTHARMQMRARTHPP